MKDNIIYGYYLHSKDIVMNDTIVFDRNEENPKFYTEESEPLKFEVNRAYKTRDGEKVYLFKILKNGGYNLYFVGGDGLNFWTNNVGEYMLTKKIHELDIIGYWDE